MKNVVKAGAITAGMLVVLIVVNIICNTTGHEMDPLYTGTITPMIAMALYSKIAGEKANRS